jgi:hypothetical protein
MSKEFNIIGLAVESIKNDNLDQLDRALRIMPVEKINDEEETLLTTFLTLCAGYNRPKASKLVLERWSVAYPDNDRIPLFSRLFLLQKMNDPTLAFLVLTNPEYTYVELIDNLARFDSSQQVGLACVKLENIFGLQSHNTYNILRDHAVEFENFVVEEYMVDKMMQTAPFAKVPTYIQNYLKEYIPEYEDRLPTQKELYTLADEQKEEDRKDIDSISDDEALKMLTEGLERHGISIVEMEEAKKFLEEQLKTKKRELLEPILKSQEEKELEQDRVLFWTFGPSNPLVGQDLTIDAPSYKYGGCRMFLCDLFDYDEEYDYVADWFTGNCQHCLLKIKERWHAVRLPRAHGGWEGCFCSWKCVSDYWRATEQEKDILTRKIIEIFEKKTREIGIQDRV